MRTGTFTLLAAVALAGPAATAGASRGGCYPSGSRTIVASTSERAYLAEGRAYTCLYSAGLRVLLGEWDFDARRGLSDGQYVWPILLRGDYVAYVTGFDHHDGGAHFAVRVRDLRSGRELHEWRSATSYPDAGVALGKLVATRSGAAAWTTGGYNAGWHGAFGTVRVSDRHHTAKVIDSGFDVDPDSLRLAGHTIHWRRGGEPRRYVVR